MNIKPRQIPLIVEEVDAVLSRLPPFHSKRPHLEEEKRNYMSGYNGERQIDYFLDSYINGSPHYYASLRLLQDNKAFQIDTLIVTNYFILIIESKNIRGKLIFEKNSTQVIRELNGTVQGFQNPIVQVARQKKLLNAWLKRHKFPPIPIIDLVGIADRRTIISTTKDNMQIFNKLFYADVIEEEIIQLERMYHQVQLTPKQLQKLKHILLKKHTPAPPSILKKHGITLEELLFGARCPTCGQFHLKRVAKKWYCGKCLSYSTIAHQAGIRDYLLIISERITNKECREFLMIDCPNLAKRLLKKMNLPTTGANKNRLYHRPPNF